MSRSNRQTFVNLSVFAGSAALFATAWTGVVEADRAANESIVAASPVGEADARVAAAPVTARVAVAPTAVQTQAAPAPPPRQVVVVRQSRAS